MYYITLEIRLIDVVNVKTHPGLDMAAAAFPFLRRFAGRVTGGAVSGSFGRGRFGRRAWRAFPTSGSGGAVDSGMGAFLFRDGAAARPEEDTVLAGVAVEARFSEFVAAWRTDLRVLGGDMSNWFHKDADHGSRSISTSRQVECHESGDDQAGKGQDEGRKQSQEEVKLKVLWKYLGVG